MERWIDYKEVMEIVQCKETLARKIIGEVNAEIKQNKGIVPRKGRAPRLIVLEKLAQKENT